ncbi:MAG: hypothetical protein Q6358_06240 [Candidatus Brocadiales bacterium]|nr:hypothetical protein [Candidatus Brocadiales bacterium]
MGKSGKELSNPFSTGGGGGQFEAHVQASFVVLMLTGGFVPCLPCWPISKIKLQGKFAGYDTEDLIVFVEKTGSNQKRKILGQIKHSISIAENDKVFSEVIQAAWNDFNNASLFSRGKDAIALITGPLSATDVNDVRTILEWARHSENADEFIKKVELTHFSSQRKQNKLQAFKINLKNANGGNPVSDDILFEFLKHFHLLGYDLDIKAGVTLSLLYSLIGQYSQENAQSLWSRLVDEVQSANKNAGTISPESLPVDLQTAFKQRIYEVIPNEFSAGQLPSAKPDWNQHAHASDLVIANLLGAWNEKNAADLEVVRQLANEEFGSWISKIREILQQPASPVSLRNGRWCVTERKGLWQALGTRLFDDNLDNLKKCVVTVLSERDPQFDLPPEERYAASIHGKVLKHSPELRKGIAESLALLVTQPDDLNNCSQNKPEIIAVLAVREIFENADWVLWGSLNNLLPVLAEAAPDEFLNAVENALQQTPCPLDELFSQEGNGITGRNYLTGLLWALETLAWDEKFFVRVCVILGDLASHDPSGNWANRPANSLTTILLPWLPQTTASINKRKVALQTLQKEVPAVAWKLLLSLLPNQHQMSTGAHKPSWRNTIPDGWKKGVTQQEYWEQVSFYAELAVSMTSNDMAKLNELIGHLDNLPEPSFDNILDYLSSKAVCNKPEDERLVLWTKLTKFASKHRRFSDAKWALSSGIISKIEAAVAKLAPKNPLNLHRRLFSGRDFDLYEEKGNWKKQRQKLEERRQEAIKDILIYGGMDAVVRFAESVESPFQVGHSMGVIAESEIDASILPALLETENKKLAQLASGYVWSRQNRHGWAWVDGLDKSGWSVTQVGQLLSYLPFTEETWKRAAAWLGEFEKEYWISTSVNPYHTDGDIGAAIDKLIEYGRPHAAIDCLNRMLYDKQPLDKSRSVKALLAAVSSTEPSYTMDAYHIVEIIKALQNDPGTDLEDLFRVEWAYLPLLDRNHDASPKLLENRLASDPAFFCEVIRLIYRSKKEDKSEKEPNERDKAIATNAWRLLHEWRTPPGTQLDGSFSREQFTQWLEYTKKACAESGHLEVALTHVGQVLFYCPPDPQGLWIDQTAADALNGKDAEKMRDGFRMEVFNSRGVHWVDPNGKPERELAEQYRQKGDDVENAGYQRFAATLRSLSESYDCDAERIVAEHNGSDTDNE